MPLITFLRCSLLYSLTSLYSASFSSAASVNVTLDDSASVDGSAIYYIPQSQWDYNHECRWCPVGLDLQRLHNRTLHAARYDPQESSHPQNVTFAFTGSAIYVYGVQPLIPDSSNPADLSFFINGEYVGQYTPITSKSQPFIYNVLLYFNDSMPFEAHTFTLQNGRLGGNVSSVLLDYLVYTVDNSTAGVSTSGSTVDHSSASVATPSTNFTITSLVPAVSTMTIHPSATYDSVSTSSLLRTITSVGAPLGTSTGSLERNSTTHSHQILTICLATIFSILIVAAALFFIRRRRHSRRVPDDMFIPLNHPSNELATDDSKEKRIDLPAMQQHVIPVSEEARAPVIQDPVGAIPAHASLPQAGSSQRPRAYSASSDALSYYDPGQPVPPQEVTNEPTGPGAVLPSRKASVSYASYTSRGRNM